MAGPGEIANDMRARAKLYDGRHLQGRMLSDDARAMRRAADMIDQQQRVIAYLEAAAEVEAQKYENYVYGAKS
jgi:hypothetical protein